MGTTKLTRKEILAEDPVHQALVGTVELFRAQGKTVALLAASAVLVGIAVFLGLRFLESREANAQQLLARGMSFFHAQIDPSALDDPFGKGPDPVFRTEDAKYQAAIKELSSVISKYGSSKLAVIARYYLGQSQMKLGQRNEATRSLEIVSGNTKDRTLGYLAKKLLATYYMDMGNTKAAQTILESMIKDPQCELPKEDLKLDLSRVYLVQGKREEAIKVLREARDQSSRSMLQSLLNRELSRLESGTAPGLTAEQAITATVRP